jgi:hypothetical protein
MVSCTGDAPVEIAENRPVAYVTAEGAPTDTSASPMPYMLMADSQVTVNDRCPVRKVRLSLRLPALYVNGRPVGFC